MGRDIHLHLAKFDKETNLYKEICLYRKREKDEFYSYYDEEGNEHKITDPMKKVSIYDSRNYEMFDGLKCKDPDNYGYFPAGYINYDSLDSELREVVEEKTKTTGYYDFAEVNLADMKIYVLEHPTVVDYDSYFWEKYEEGKCEKPVKKNPIKWLYEDIINYLNLADREFSWGLTNVSNYKLIFYFDC